MKSIVLALGYFDALHVGHQAIIEEAVNQSKNLMADPVLFTFDGDLGAFLKKSEGVVFTFNERLELLNGFGIKDVHLAPLNKEYLSISKKDFLDGLNDLYNIKAYVCGDDFTFGNMAEGDVEYLIEYAKKRDQKVIVKKEVSCFNERVSTSRIKKLLQNGCIEEVNALLGFDYFITGKVEHGRGVGKTLNFPTVNVDFSPEKFLIKNAVYAGYTFIDGQKYKCVINYGQAPTFGAKFCLEAHLIGYSGNLYGKSLKIYFNKFLRNIVKFSSPEDLINQLTKDVESV